MAIAKYFSKDLLAINQLINSSQDSLEKILSSTKVGIGFDKNGAETKEGAFALDLITRLLARLYPNLSIIDLSKSNGKKVSALHKLAKNINSNIGLTDTLDDLDVLIVAGQTNKKPKIKGKLLFIGSDNWIGNFSLNGTISFGDSNNPFGPGVAACIGAANLFRVVFHEFFQDKGLDKNLTFSPLTCSIDDSIHNPKLKSVDLKDVSIVGIGAIGNGAIWALSKLENLTGSLNLIDSEKVSISNLQRYVMFDENDIEQKKVEVALKKFSSPKLKVNLHFGNWSSYLKERGDYNVHVVGVAIDNKKDRIGIQSSLPRKIINSYTEANLLGISRHNEFGVTACLACGYIPTQQERNYISEVAENCNIPQYVNLVKDYLNLDIPVETPRIQNTGSILDVIAQANTIQRGELDQFHGKKISQFYSEFVCGGISLSLSNSSRISNVDAPLAFQSAMAGILLAAEIIIDAGGYRNSPIKQVTHIHPLNIFNKNNPFNHQLKRDDTGRCVCSDNVFINQYKAKWQETQTTI
ncbi:E2 ligase fold family C protein [Aurantibacillus circumpalustris]|uniref:E2 ligase fold family C protein n=1 Tax=Aurantibacillus circumpalustris TaxID=3036359 RepID=UPI00295A9CF4|nr:E2 ligase fold family C protein [Aurantibacillus circumpalustris]